MEDYFDTGALVPLYADEVFSEAVTEYNETRGEPIPFSLFQRVEFENALRLKVFRKEINETQLNLFLLDVDEDLAAGRFIMRPLNWIDVFDKARSIGSEATVKTGCRTLDLIHVAIAVLWGCPTFVSADERQLAAAKMQGLKAVDLRALHRRHSGSSGAAGEVREKRAGYAAKKTRK